MNRRFADLDIVRNDIKAHMPLNEIIELIDGHQSLQYVNEHLYKKCCTLNEHPVDADGTKDSTPSFTVNPDKEMFYCFGCGAGGDRFEYASKVYNIEHIEAIEKVAELQGFDLTPYYVELTDEEKVMSSLFSENNTARDIAHSCLLSNEKAMEYLLSRGISLESIEEFKLGYAPLLDSSDVTLFNNVPNRYALQLMRKDMMSDALLFPVNDATGKMRYFQSRPFTPQVGMKYIGAGDDHPLFNDIDRVYGLDVARKKLRKWKGRLVGVEGAPDTIMCNQIGIPAIAFLGTAINEQRIQFLERFRVTELILVLDGDKAGINSMNKTIRKYLSWKTTVKLRVAILPEGLDPNDFINKYGKDALYEIIEKAPYALQYLVDQVWEEVMKDGITLTNKIMFLNETNEFVSMTQDKLIRNMLIRYIAEKIELDIMEVTDYYMSNIQQAKGEVQLFNVKGEEVVLAEMIRNEDFALDVIALMDADDWYLEKHKKLFDIIRKAKYRDMESLATTVTNLNLEKLIPLSWLRSLSGVFGNHQSSLEDIHDKLMRRKTKEELKRLNSMIEDMEQDPLASIDQSMGNIYNVTINKADDMIFDATDQVDSAMKLIMERMQSGVKIIGYDLGPGFQRLTNALMGLQGKTLTVVAANQSVGKTQLSENWAMHLAVNENIETGWISLEMDSDRMTFRHLAMLSGLPLRNIMTGDLSMQDMTTTLMPWSAKLRNAPFFLSERGHDLAESLAIARRWVTRNKVKVIFIDYIQLQYITGRLGTDRHRELGIISKAWKQFSKETNTAVVAISQLSKQALDADIAKAEHGAGSYEIAQDADNYITLKEKSEEDIQNNGIEHGNIVLNIDKNRSGEADILINIYSERSCQRMYEVD